GTVIGSAAYCAPEQAMGKPQYGSDLYSLGVTCLYLLTQVSPSNLYDPLELQWVWREHLNDNQLSEKLGKILDRLVETVFNKRYQSVAQVWADLQPSDDSPKPPTQKFKFDIVTVNSMGREINRRPGQAECIIEDLGNGVTLEMVLIPGGTFIMGASSGEPRSSNAERPQHQVTIKPFLMGKYPVTQAQWRQVASFPKLQRNLSLDPSRFKGFNLPVEKVSWYDVVEWCDRLSKVISKPCRLPSEAEWEYAARAGRTSPFHVGDTLTTDLANYDGNYSYSSGLKGVFRKKTTPVGRFQSANAFGLYDIHGNVWEWCADPWRDNYNGAPSDGTVWDSQDIDVDNLVKLLESKDRRVLRGGSWSNLPVFCRCASRNSAYPGNLLHNFGFRVACAL
ncbi:MAG: SUMF1/EgtB/PvdO family nonheme iron enzyme, partial [Limnospira sp. PMC 894.15]|uniref:bifunctional serine/threonine-protein kinase/formylglycine-generating enzyme family protein n=1 Tax=Limnospira sp. PMC 894.15 TaxID=2981100 RepID=UPI0028E0B1C6